MIWLQVWSTLLTSVWLLTLYVQRVCPSKVYKAIVLFCQEESWSGSGKGSFRVVWLYLYIYICYRILLQCSTLCSQPRMPRWNISHIHLIYLICPFGRDPIESISKGEPCSKKISRKVIRQIFCLSHSQQPNHIFYSQFSQVATDRGFLLVQEMAQHVTAPWRAAMCRKA